MSESDQPVQAPASGERRTAPPLEGGRVPASAFVAVRTGRPALVVTVRRGLPRHHALMLILAAALMIMGGMRAHRHPMHKAIVIPTPAVQGILVT